MREIEDRALEALLVRTLAEHADEIPFTLTSDVVRARLEDRRRRRRSVIPGRRIVMLGLAAVLLVPIAAFVAGSLRTPEGPRIIGPNPAVTALPVPSIDLPAPSAPVADAYQALVVRIEPEAAVIVAARADRQERVIASLPTAGRRLGSWHLSADGWLAMFYQEGLEFIDLRDPGSAPRPFSMGDATTGFSWHPDGRFAYWDESGAVTLIDPKTGAKTEHTVRGPLTDVVAWSADGSALLVYGEGRDSIYAGGERVTDPAWRVVRLDGGPDETTVPELDLGLARSARYGVGGARLQPCAEGRDCPDALAAAVISDVPGGSVTTWYNDELAPDEVDDVSFGGDGTGVWLLLDRRVGGRQFALARVESSGAARLVAVSGLPEAWYNALAFEGIAPDDSLVAVHASRLVLVEAVSGRSTPIDGRFLGFVSSATADTWAGEPFEPVVPSVSLAPVVPAYPVLPPLGDLVANQLIPGDRELWHQEYIAVEGQAAAPSTVEIGPVNLKTGLGLVLVCSGPSDVAVTMDAPIPNNPITPLLANCDSGDGSGGQVPWLRANVSASFVVSANTDTSWQLVIFDPAPE